MFTIFDLFELIAKVGGALVGLMYGLQHFGVIGAILGTPIGFIAGVVVGRVPYAIGKWFADHQFRKLSNEALLLRIAPDHFIELPFVLHEMARRSMDLELARQPIVEMLEADKVFDKDYVRRARDTYLPKPEERA